MTELLRQIKLYSLLRDRGRYGLAGAKASSDPRVPIIYAFFDRLFDGLYIEVIREYHPKHIIFHKDGKFYMEHNTESQVLVCRYDGYWSYLQKDLGLGVNDTPVILKIMVNKFLNTRVEKHFFPHGVHRPKHIAPYTCHIVENYQRISPPRELPPRYNMLY